MKSIEIIIDPSAVEIYNSIADFIQNAAASVLGEISKSPIDPNSLPVVRLVDNERTRATLLQIKPWATPLTLLTKAGPFGSSIEKIEIHPRVVIQRAYDMMNCLDGQEEAVRQYVNLHKDVSQEIALRHFIDQAALTLIAGNTVFAYAPESEPETIEKVIKIAIGAWDIQQGRV